MSVIDLMIRIKNGYMARKPSIQSPHSSFRVEVLKKLKELKYIADYSVSEDQLSSIEIILSYADDMPAMTNITLVSKPGQRQYISYTQLQPVQDGMGTQLLSTSKGILTDREAKKLKAGGELLFQIW
jgi:small subunit ribosomal protein S8